MLFTILLVFAIVIICSAIINTALVSAINARFVKNYGEMDTIETTEQ